MASSQVLSTLSALEEYNSRLKGVIQTTKNKDSKKRNIEKDILKCQLQHVDNVASISIGDKLETLEEEYYHLHEKSVEKFKSTVEERGQKQSEIMQLKTLVSIKKGEYAVLEKHRDAAERREREMEMQLKTLQETQQDDFNAPLEREALALENAEARMIETDKLVIEKRESRPSKFPDATKVERSKSLVQEAHKLRESHQALMSNLHAQEGQEISQMKQEIDTKFNAEEAKLKSHFSEQELSLVDKAYKHQEKLKEMQVELEAKLRKEQAETLRALRLQITQLKETKVKTLTKVDAQRKEAVDVDSDIHTSTSTIEYLTETKAKRIASIEEHKVTKASLESELEKNGKLLKIAERKTKHFQCKYKSMIKQNNKMFGAIEEFTKLVEKAENEVEFTPPTKRIRVNRGT